MTTDHIDEQSTEEASFTTTPIPDFRHVKISAVPVPGVALPWNEATTGLMGEHLTLPLIYSRPGSDFPRASTLHVLTTDFGLFVFPIPENYERLVHAVESLKATFGQLFVADTTTVPLNDVPIRMLRLCPCRIITESWSPHGYSSEALLAHRTVDLTEDIERIASSVCVVAVPCPEEPPTALVELLKQEFEQASFYPGQRPMDVFFQVRDRLCKGLDPFIAGRMTGLLTQIVARYGEFFEVDWSMEDLNDQLKGTSSIGEQGRAGCAVQDESTGQFFVVKQRLMRERIDRQPASKNPGEIDRSLETLKGLMQPKILKPISAKSIERLEKIKLEAPNFRHVADHVLRRAKSMKLGGGSFSTTPILLVGPPGIGKTHFMQLLSEALDLPTVSIPCTANLALLVNGLSKNWGSAGAGRIAETLSVHDEANPVVLLDEIDKISRMEYSNSDVLLPLLESLSARHFVDSYVEVEINAAHVTFIATANDEDRIDPVLHSRFDVFHIEVPTEVEREQIIDQIYRNLISDHPAGRFMLRRLTQSVIRHLIHAVSDPRSIRKVLQRAIDAALARADGADTSSSRSIVLSGSDIDSVCSKPSLKARMGF